MQNRSFAVDNQRMARVVPALESHHRVGAFGQQVDDGALPFIAPLRADYDDVAAHRLSSDKVEKYESGNHHGEPEATQVAVLPAGDGGDSAPPGAGRGKWEKTLNDQEKRDAGEKIGPGQNSE